MHDVPPDRRFRLLNTALERIGCTLQQAFLCHLLFNAQFNGSPEECLEITYKELASRPTRCCCSVQELRNLINRLQLLGFVRQLSGPKCHEAGGDHNAPIELQLDWNGILAIVETHTSPVA